MASVQMVTDWQGEVVQVLLLCSQLAQQDVGIGGGGEGAGGQVQQTPSVWGGVQST